MNYEKLWDQFSESRRWELLRCTLHGRGLVYNKHTAACTWTNLPGAICQYLQESDWEFILGKCRYQLETT